MPRRRTTGGALGMTLTAIEAMLEQRIGLSPESIGRETIAKAVERRRRALALADEAAYRDILDRSKAEMDELIELVVVPETWFFRNKESFAFLTRQVRSEWLPRPEPAVLRVLSIPCASGEEPFSIGMALLDSGLPPERFRIDAVDISPAALNKARRGIYGRESFRGKHLSFRDRYFFPVSDGYQVIPELRELVRFLRGNLMEESVLIDEAPYDVIFCRNLLIYLSEGARSRVTGVIGRLLAKKGLLFLGHVERPLVCGSGYDWIRQPGVFVCQRLTDAPPVPSPAAPRARPVPPSGSGQPARAGASHPASSRSRPCRVNTTSASPVRKPPSVHLPAAFGGGNGSPPAHAGTDSPTSPTSTDLQEAQRLADGGDMDAAVRICERCLNENAFHIGAHFLMGLICHAQDDEERAEAHFNKAVYLDPNHHEALSHLAFIMEHRGQRNQAERLRQRAQRIQQRENGS